MSIVHFMGPFLINIVSAVGIITIAARHRTKAEKKRSYCTHLHIQIRDRNGAGKRGGAGRSGDEK
jgi:hypothetical protein